MYVIQRNDGAYVAAPGSPSSYTRQLERARRFPTIEAAERELCVGNERIVPLESLLSRY
jgi:hypothetical protein